jgi:hypothetical protein
MQWNAKQGPGHSAHHIWYSSCAGLVLHIGRCLTDISGKANRHTDIETCRSRLNHICKTTASESSLQTLECNYLRHRLRPWKSWNAPTSSLTPVTLPSSHRSLSHRPIRSLLRLDRCDNTVILRPKVISLRQCDHRGGL